MVFADSPLVSQAEYIVEIETGIGFSPDEARKTALTLRTRPAISYLLVGVFYF
jgi:hypothetical protein